jgi:hypothetical protein
MTYPGNKRVSLFGDSLSYKKGYWQPPITFSQICYISNYSNPPGVIGDTIVNDNEAKSVRINDCQAGSLEMPKGCL